jgi:predicted transcriptional regulator
MKSVLIQLDEPTYRALSRVAPATERRRSQFIREAIRRAIRDAEYARIRAAYEAKPDSEAEADDWSSAEEYQR